MRVKTDRFFDVAPSRQKGRHSIERITSRTGFRRAEQFVNENHSYIDWADRPSRKMYWLLYEDDCLVGVFGLGSAFARPKPMADFMSEHDISFNELGNNIVFCMSGQEDRNAGTKFLGLVRRDAKEWWQERYGDTLRAIQTFILPPRNGAVYRADNWQLIGETSGKSQAVRTLTKEEAEGYTGSIERREFKSGEVKFLVRSFVETPKKLMFVRMI